MIRASLGIDVGILKGVSPVERVQMHSNQKFTNFRYVLAIAFLMLYSAVVTGQELPQTGAPPLADVSKSDAVPAIPIGSKLSNSVPALVSKDQSK